MSGRGQDSDFKLPIRSLTLECHVMAVFVAFVHSACGVQELGHDSVIDGMLSLLVDAQRGQELS